MVETCTLTVRVKLDSKTGLVRREFQHRVVSDGQDVVDKIKRVWELRDGNPVRRGEFKVRSRAQ